MPDSSRRYPRWLWLLIAVALFLSSVPYVIGYLLTPEGSLYLGVHTNIDDHAVYASWIKQSRDGHFLFENRFTTDAQPMLTINLYFLLLGKLAIPIGIPLAMHVGRVLFGALFLLAAYRMAKRIAATDLQVRLAVGLCAFGMGLGAFAWQRYGHSSPVDVWQPEAFGFSSLMTNGLFCASLWLILLIWESILESRESWRPVAAGFIAALVLANIHTYDMLTIALVACGFLVSAVVSRRATVVWVGRSLLIASGALPAVAWFVYVRANDPVFALRADTPTLSPDFLLVLLGYGGMLLLAAFALCSESRDKLLRCVPALAMAIFISFLLSGLQAGETPTEPWQFIAAFALLLLTCAIVQVRNEATRLMAVWVCIGFVALYYPGMFQRKLTMGLHIPLALLAGVGVGMIAERVRETSRRSALAYAVVLLLSVSSIRWIQREIQMATENVSNTTMHSVYLSEDAAHILRILQSEGRASDVLIAAPGVAHRLEDGGFGTPLIPDLNPIMTGWGGVRTWVGHWSETPTYAHRRARATSELFGPEASLESARALLAEIRARWVIWPTAARFRDAGFAPEDWVAQVGKRVHHGKEYSLYVIR